MPGENENTNFDNLVKDSENYLGVEEGVLASKIVSEIEKGNISWDVLRKFKENNIPSNDELEKVNKKKDTLIKNFSEEWNEKSQKINKIYRQIVNQDVSDITYGPNAVKDMDKRVGAINEALKNLGNENAKKIQEAVDKYKVRLNKVDRSIKSLSAAKEKSEIENKKIKSISKIINEVEEEKSVLEACGKAGKLRDDTNMVEADRLLKKILFKDENYNQSQTVSSPNQSTNPYVDRNINPAQNFNLNNNSIIFSNDNNVPVRTKKKSYRNVEFEYPEDWSMESNPDGSDVLKDSQGKEVATITKDGNGEIKNINMNFENGGCVIVNGKPLNIPPGSQMKMKITSDGVKYNVINRAGESIMNGTINKSGEYVGPHVDNTFVNRPRWTFNQPFSSPASAFQSPYPNTTLNPDSLEGNENRIALGIIAERTINLNPEIAARNDLTNNVAIDNNQDNHESAQLYRQNTTQSYH
ncbi:MAG: hypothetical protein K6D38_09735 [Pseudobutyrivibrio sp.]|nr:hypothetical protein [Pseudobutyrivibrio sp.]